MHTQMDGHGPFWTKPLSRENNAVIEDGCRWCPPPPIKVEWGGWLEKDEGHIDFWDKSWEGNVTAVNWQGEVEIWYIWPDGLPFPEYSKGCSSREADQMDNGLTRTMR